jgi:hypothetical protein
MGNSVAKRTPPPSLVCKDNDSKNCFTKTPWYIQLFIYATLVFYGMAIMNFYFDDSRLAPYFGTFMLILVIVWLLFLVSPLGFQPYTYYSETKKK